MPFRESKFTPTCELPEGVIGMFARAAQNVDRNQPWLILRGINLSSAGIATTNGKELVNYELPLNLEDNLTIQLPLALIQSKASEAGVFSYWQDGVDFRFRIQVGAWNWIGKTISGMYPNWKQVVPKEGLEPSWYRYRQILSLVRLPFRHFGLHGE